MLGPVSTTPTPEIRVFRTGRDKPFVLAGAVPSATTLALTAPWG